MDSLGLIIIVSSGFLITWYMKRKNRGRFDEMLRASNALALHARQLSERLSCELSETSRIAQGHCYDVRRVYSPSLTQVAEQIVYTKRTVKTFYDPLSRLSVTFTTAESIIAVGGELDLGEFRALLKEKERDRAAADFSAEMREKTCTHEVLPGIKNESGRKTLCSEF